MNEFYDYFKSNNSSTNAECDQEININLNNDNEILNSKFTGQEILKCIKNLKNNKSFGNDIILNEYIKSTADQMLPIYTHLFNLIFDTGIIPDIWLEGIIRPIYKNKGDVEKP